jgi:hypothetical protein
MLRLDRNITHPAKLHAALLSLQRLAKQGDSEAVAEALVAEGNESRAACHLIARDPVNATVSADLKLQQLPVERDTKGA